MVQKYSHSPITRPGPKIPTTANVGVLKPGAGSPFKGTSLGGSFLSRIGSAFGQGIKK